MRRPAICIIPGASQSVRVRQLHAPFGSRDAAVAGALEAATHCGAAGALVAATRAQMLLAQIRVGRSLRWDCGIRCTVEEKRLE